MSAVPPPVEVFCSYAHEDEAWLRELETHLGLLNRQGLISLWHDRLISPGTNWAQAIDSRLETASVILLLVSADFFASDYCFGIEMQRALERQEVGEARVIPILVRPVDWATAPFAHLQALPTDAKPLTMWKNKDAALADITAGLRRVFAEEVPQLTARAPRAALPPIWNIPYPRNPFFLGRDDELAQLRRHLQGGRATALAQPQAIGGLGGIGKTQLALEYAYRYHQNYQAVLWARAESTEAVISSYVAIASLLRLPEREAKEQEVIVQAVKTWLQTRRDWLLILDNADEFALLPAFLPPSLGGHLLITTRAAVTGRLAHRLEIETLVPEDAVLFLLRRAGLLAPDGDLSHASPLEREQAEKLTLELGGLPLALDQAGAYLEETGMDLLSYWHLYQQHRADLLQQRGGLVTDHPAPVATTWSLSFEQVEEKQPAAADLLRVCAFLSPDAIPEEILTASASSLGPVLSPVAADAFHLNQVIEALRAYSLVRRDPKGKTLSIHRLVQAVLQDAQEEAERRTWAERALRAVNAAFPHAEYGMWPQCERLLPQALTAAQVIEQYQFTLEEAGRLLCETASYLHDRARYTQAELLYRQALHIREQQGGPDHPQVADLLHGLASLYYEQGKYSQAELLYHRALHIQEQQGGPDHPDVVPPLNNLASLYADQGKYGPAEVLYQRVLRICEQQLGPDHLDVAPPLIGLASLYADQGKYGQAEVLYQRALHIQEQHMGPDHPHMASSLDRLANLYSQQGKYSQAEPLYQRALAICEQQLGPDHPQMAYPLHGLANLYSQQGKYSQAEPLYQRALHIREQHLGTHHSETAEAIHALALFQETLGNYQEALSLYQRAFMIREQALGLEHPKTRATHQRLTALVHSLRQDAPEPLQEHSRPEQGKQNP